MTIINTIRGEENGSELVSAKGDSWWSNYSEASSTVSASQSGRVTVASTDSDESFTTFNALVAILISFSILSNVAVLLATIFR